MSLSDLASIGSFVSGVAVLTSLVFLYVQLRHLRAQVAQTERNQRAMINDSFVSRVNETLRWSSDPTNNSLFTRVFQGEQCFTADEIVRLTNNFRAVILNALAVTQHYEAGLIDFSSYDTTMLILRRVLGRPVYRAIWETQTATASPQLRKLVEDLLPEIPLQGPIDIVGRFNADLSKVLGASGPPQSASA
jgi:hypothetical protein